MLTNPNKMVKLNREQGTDFLLPKWAFSKRQETSVSCSYAERSPFYLEDIMPSGFRKDGSKLGFQKGNEYWKSKKTLAHTEITKDKMKKSHTGKIGSNASAWKGDDATYKPLHARVSKQRGKPQFCEICKTTDKKKRYEWANLTGKYADIMDYKRMCESCHKKYDNQRRNEWQKRINNIPMI